jgi:hypothetical protein
MSGGAFDYKQYYIEEIANSIEAELEKQGKERPKDEFCYDKEYYDKYPQERFYYTYPKEIQEKMAEAVKQLRIACIYAQRIDWFLSGDDGDENFLKRLQEDLDNLVHKNKKGRRF